MIVDLLGAVACANHVSTFVTHQILLNFGKIKFLTPDFQTL